MNIFRSNLKKRRSKFRLKFFLFLFIVYILNQFFVIDSIVDLFLDTKEIDCTVTYPNENELSIHFLDVGQSESILVIQNDKIMLIDTSLPQYGGAICRYLEDLGIEKIDVLVLTHPHMDHIGGASKILRTIKVDKIYISDTTSKNSIQNLYHWNIRRIAFFRHSNVEFSVTGEQFQLGSANVQFIAPISYDYSCLNNYSIGMKISYKNISTLMLADAEAESEEELLSSNYDLNCDILKISHHGSITSSTNEFLDLVNPKYAILSVGNDNTYGHPTKTVMKRLKKRKIPVYRTDELGNIIVTTDGEKITFNTKSGDYMYRKVKK